MKNFWKALAICVLAVAIAPLGAQTNTVASINFVGGVNSFKVWHGSGAPADTCIAGWRYIQDDADAGKNGWDCVNGHMKQQGGSASGVSLPSTTNLFKGDNAGGAVAATPGTDYATPASVTAASNAASAAQTTANAAIPTSQKGANNGVAPLDSSGKVPSANLPAATGGVTLPNTTNLLKGDNAGGASAAIPGTDYPTVASVTSAASAASSAQTTANAAIPATQKGANNGVATLGSDGKVPTAQLPSSAAVPAAGVVYSNGTTLSSATPAQLSTALVDATKNSAATFQAGSGGDSTAPAPSVGKYHLAFVSGALQLSRTGAAYSPLLLNADVGTSVPALTSGKVPVAQLPVFVASGASHAAGIVPDPGSSAGTTRYLREDNTWVAPPSSGGGLSGLTTGQVPIANSATTVNASKPLVGDGAAIQTGPATGTAENDIAQFGPNGALMSTGIKPWSFLQHIANDDVDFAVTAVPATTCSIAATVVLGYVNQSDKVMEMPDVDITAITGYGANGLRIMRPYIDTNKNIIWKVCNPTGASITPGALNMPWAVVR